LSARAASASTSTATAPAPATTAAPVAPAFLGSGRFGGRLHVGTAAVRHDRFARAVGVLLGFELLAFGLDSERAAVGRSFES
jgi:hypothetical protein